MKRSIVFLTALLLLVLVLPAAAQDMMDTPSVDVSDQVILNGSLTVNSAYSDGPGFIVIHVDNGEGRPGPVIGHRAISSGWNYNINVVVDAAQATPTLFAMLHTDTGETGVYEFGSVEGVDGPVAVDGNVVTPAFAVDVINAHNQFIEGSVAIASVTAQVDGWLVIHADNGEGRPGPVLGETMITAGRNDNVVVELMGDATNTLWPMLHVDTGEAGVYEFGSVEGADGPVRVNGVVAVTPISTVPAMTVSDQIVTTSLTAASVLSEGDGWLVIHADNGEGGPGPVLGQTLVSPGLNTNVVVELMGDVTPVLWPMLHVDTGEAGVYEFGSVEGADGPVRVNDAVLTFPINAAPSITYQGSLDGTVLTVNSALIDAAGWLVIHADNGEGGPGPVIGYAPVTTGANYNISVELASEGITETLFPMLHYDTGAAGVYEFGSVEGADGPVRVNDAVVVGPLSPMMVE